MADVNPWSNEGWNVTAQGQYEKEKGVARAEARARDAGTTRGGKRPGGSSGGGDGSSDEEKRRPIPGPRGRQGDKGDKGDKGDPGTPGSGDGSVVSLSPPGRDGDDGEPGPPGRDGAPGTPGIPGTSGADGASAIQYPPGRDGDDGEPGPPGVGIPGTPGTPGTPGAPGTNGSDGAVGPPGRDGEDADTQWLFPNGAQCSALPFNDPNLIWDYSKSELTISGTFTTTIASLASGLQVTRTITNNAATVAAVGCRGTTFNGNGAAPTGGDFAPTFAPSASIAIARASASLAIAAPAVGITITDLMGSQGRCQFNDVAGAVTNGNSFIAIGPNLVGALKPTNQHGLRVNNQGGSGITNAYGIRIDAQSVATNNYGLTSLSTKHGLGTETPDASTILDLTSTTSGFGPPRMTTTQRNAIASPMAGLCIFNTTVGDYDVYDGIAWSSDRPFYSGAAGDPVMGIPGATSYGQLVTNTITGQRIFYSPFILRRATKFIGIDAITGGTVSTSPTFFWGIYTWDLATGKPTTLQGSVSQAVAASTGYSLNFSSPLTLPPGRYAAAFLCDKTGVQSVLYGAFHMDGDGFFHRSTNTFLRPKLYASASGKTTLPSPESVAPTGFDDPLLTAEGYGLNTIFFNYFRYQAP